MDERTSPMLNDRTRADVKFRTILQVKFLQHIIIIIIIIISSFFMFDFIRKCTLGGDRLDKKWNGRLLKSPC